MYWTHQQSQSTCGLAHIFGGIHAENKYHHIFTQEFSDLIQIFDHRCRQDVNEKIDDEVRNGMFDTGDRQMQKNKIN